VHCWSGGRAAVRTCIALPGADRTHPFPNTMVKTQTDIKRSQDSPLTPLHGMDHRMTSSCSRRRSSASRPSSCGRKRSCRCVPSCLPGFVWVYEQQLVCNAPLPWGGPAERCVQRQHYHLIALLNWVISVNARPACRVPPGLLLALQALAFVKRPRLPCSRPLTASSRPASTAGAGAGPGQ